MSERDAGKHAHLARLKARVDKHESTMTEGLRGFNYSTYPTSDGSGVGRYIFHDCQVVGIDDALLHLADVARSYGLDVD